MLIPDTPSVEPVYVTTEDGIRLASYRYGDPSLPTVVAVHGFASNAFLNWELSGWVRALGRAGYGVLALDLRGHGASEAPLAPERYSLSIFAADVLAVMHAHGLERAHYLGYSMGARTGWRLGLAQPEYLRSLSLGGMPSGDPLTAFDMEAARRYLDSGEPVTDPLTAGYIRMGEGVDGNNLRALMAVVAGVRGSLHAAIDITPRLPALLVTGSEDAVAPGSRALAEASGAAFVELPGRGHLSAVGARGFKDAVIEFLLRLDGRAP